MPALLIFTGYLGLAMVLTALVYYPVYVVLDAIWEVRPGRVFYRLAMIFAVLGFWPLLKLLGIDNRNALGYSLDHRRFLRTFSRGLGIGVLIMIVHSFVLVASDARAIPDERILIGDLLYALISGLLTGLLVAIIEESLFRGALQYEMRRRQTLSTTIVLTSLLYAALHFVRAPEPAAGTAISWFSGWEMLTGIFDQFYDFSDFADSFVALFAAGLLLSLIRERNGNIALCIGIHTGWVMVIKSAKVATTTVPDSPAAWLIGSYDDIIGWAAAGILGLSSLVYWFYGRSQY